MASWHDVLEVMVRERRAALTAYARLFTGDVASAEDLVQDALVRTFARRRNVENVPAAEGYVRQAIRTAFLDGHRRGRAWRDRIHLLAQDGEHRGPESTVAARIDVQAALLALPPRERACTVLRFYDDMTVAEIAAALSLSDGAVKRYLSDAVRTLRSTLGSDAVPEDELVEVRTHGEGA